jgi:hypothetical protein
MLIFCLQIAQAVALLTDRLLTEKPDLGWDSGSGSDSDSDSTIPDDLVVSLWQTPNHDLKRSVKALTVQPKVYSSIQKLMLTISPGLCSRFYPRLRNPSAGPHRSQISSLVSILCYLVPCNRR